jgi:hypothetical protein
MSCGWTGKHAKENLYIASNTPLGEWKECTKVWSLLSQHTTDRLEHKYQELTCLNCGGTVRKSVYRKMKLG